MDKRISHFWCGDYHIGFILLFVGIQSDGIKSLLAMSKEPVYDSRMEELTLVRKSKT